MEQFSGFFCGSRLAQHATFRESRIELSFSQTSASAPPDVVIDLPFLDAMALMHELASQAKRANFQQPGNPSAH